MGPAYYQLGATKTTKPPVLLGGLGRSGCSWGSVFVAALGPERALVGLDEREDLVAHGQHLRPLVRVQGGGEATQAVQLDRALGGADESQALGLCSLQPRVLRLKGSEASGEVGGDHGSRHGSVFLRQVAALEVLKCTSWRREGKKWEEISVWNLRAWRGASVQTVCSVWVPPGRNFASNAPPCVSTGPPVGSPSSHRF